MMTMEKGEPDLHVYLLGQTRVLRHGDEVRVQPKPLHLLAYLILNSDRVHRRESLQAIFWPDKSPGAAANNLRQAIWYLRHVLPAASPEAVQDAIRWHPATAWVDAVAFERSLDADDLDAALELYGGPFLPDAYEEWAQLERERLRLRYLTALEARAHRHYKLGRWADALTDADRLLAADPLNEAAARLVMSCCWALGRREDARRRYESFRGWLRHELQADPLPETTLLYRQILSGRQHPGLASPLDEGQSAHLALLETLGAFHQGLEQAVAWAAQADGLVQAEALRWQGRFNLRLGQLAAARDALNQALGRASLARLRAAVLADLATVETALGNYAAAAGHYALALPDLTPAAGQGALSSLGGLQGRMGHTAQARETLQEAVRLAQEMDEPAALAVASGNLGILLLGQGELAAAGDALNEALAAARAADAHWLTAHLVGHLGVLAQDRGDLEIAARHYQHARTLAEAVGAARSAALWTLNLGVVLYEQGDPAEALPMLERGRDMAVVQGSRSLEAGAEVFIGACLVVQGRVVEGLQHVEGGLTLAREIGDAERVLIGLLHKGRALSALGRTAEARVALQEGVNLAGEGRMCRLEEYLRVELASLSSAGR